MKRIKITGYLSFFVNGMLAVMTGTIITYLVSDYGISYATAGKLVSAQSIGNLIMVLLSGFVIQLIGRKKTLLLFPLLFTIGFGGIAFTSIVPVLYICFILTGLGWGLCNNILNIIMMEDPEGGGISVLYTSYAVGSFMGPFLVVLVTGFGWSWKVAVLIVAAAALFLVPSFGKVKGSAVAQSVQNNKITRSDFVFLKNPRYYVCLVLYFGYIGVEVSINSWLITYLTGTGLLNKTTAQTMFSLFWLIIIFVRLFTGAYLKKIKRSLLLLIQWVGLTIGTTVMLMAGNGMQAVVIMVIMAIFMAAISPVNAENADEFIKGKGISGGIMFAIGCVGSTVLPMIVGTLADTTGITAGMKAIAGVMYLMVAVCIINGIVIKKNLEK